MSGDKVASGIAGLDQVLDGGFPRNRITLVEGAPGTGKTTVGLQFMLAAAERGERALFFSVAQSEGELRMIAESHGMDLSKIWVRSSEIDERPEDSAISVDSSESSLAQLVHDVTEAINTVKPDVMVFDSLLELRLLSSGSVAYRQNLLALRQKIRHAEVTALLLDHVADDPASGHEQGILHGVLKLEAILPPIGSMHRRLSVVKMRGSKFREGYHDFRIRSGGVSVFPRIVPSENDPGSVTLEQLGIEDETLSRMLGGGLEFGTTALIAGQAGSGKSTLSTLFARQAALQGKEAALFLFEERPEIFQARSSSLGMPLEESMKAGKLSLRHYDPTEVSPGEFCRDVVAAVEHGARVVVIDSLTGYLNALPDRDNVLTHLHTLLQYLARQGCLVLVTLAQKGLLGEPPVSELETSYLADSVIILRQYAHRSQIRRSIAVLKKRHSVHERGIQELVIRPGAVEVIELSPEAAESAQAAQQMTGA